MGISDHRVNKCISSMFIPSIDISLVMVHAEQLEERNLKQICRVLKTKRSKDGNSSQTRFEVQDNPWFKKRFPNESTSTIIRVNKGKWSLTKTKEEKCRTRNVQKSTCAKCGRKHKGKCLLCMGNFYGCGKSGYMKRDCPMMRDKWR